MKAYVDIKCTVCYGKRVVILQLLRESFSMTVVVSTASNAISTQVHIFLSSSQQQPQFPPMHLLRGDFHQLRGLQKQAANESEV